MHLSTESRVSDDAGNSVVVWRVETLAPEDRVSVATLIKCGQKTTPCASSGRSAFQSQRAAVLRSPDPESSPFLVETLRGS